MRLLVLVSIFAVMGAASTACGGSSVEPSVAQGATSITVERAVLGEAKLDGPNGGCAPSFREATLDLTSGQLAVRGCATGYEDAGAGATPIDQSEISVLSVTTLSASDLADVRARLAGYSESSSPAMQCGEDGDSYQLVVSNASTTTSYLDQEPNCYSPPGVHWVSTSIAPLFDALAYR